MFYEQDADLDLLQGKTVAILGYGSQGHAHAQNLRDSGVEVVVGLREDSTSRRRAEEVGLDVAAPAEASERGDVIMILVPDQTQKKVYDDSVCANLESGRCSCSPMGSIFTLGRSLLRTTWT